MYLLKRNVYFRMILRSCDFVIYDVNAVSVNLMRFVLFLIIFHGLSMEAIALVSRSSFLINFAVYLVPVWYYI